jgi:hypothetical protein
MKRGVAKGVTGRFEQLVAESGVPLTSLTPAHGVELMTRFLSAEYHHGQGMHSAWTVVDRSDEEIFGFVISWFDTSPGDGVYSLSLLFKIGPRSIFGDFPGVSMCWCLTPDDIPAFRSGIENSAAFRVWGRSRAADVSLVIEDQNEQPPEPPIQPGDRMTAEEWRRSDDAVAMLKALRASWRGDEIELVRLTHRYLLACCRAIWRLLPMEASRSGVEVAERFIEGRATREEFSRAEWDAEGAAFFLEPFEYEPEGEAPDEREARLQSEADRKTYIGSLVKELEEMHGEQLRRLVHLEASDGSTSLHDLLADAAYFVDSAMNYPGIRPRRSVIEKYRKFLSATLLREIVGDSFRPERG